MCCLRLQASVAQKLRGKKLHYARNADDVHEGDVSFTAFNLAQVRAVNLYEIGQHLLRHR
ncbi:Uncharacterised protein [Burkholderia pseudomallei]|nr:hypothetical protein BTQ_5288 [Burkholderia thailandensis 2002721723]AHI81817.1 hypothetical protein BTJ_3924 [Burkholderia thailandensis E444]AIC89765.1 hypothetical protein BTRA_4680 [Burkholderia thailandensis USAMRU Malaysia \